MDDLTQKQCVPCNGDSESLTPDQAAKLLAQLNEWQILNNKEIQKTFSFKGYMSTIGFVNAVAFIANKEGHHPDLEVSYNKCVVKFTTHAIGGLSENDFICAAKVDELLA